MPPKEIKTHKMANTTPLRYPGGKTKLLPYLHNIIKQNNLHDPVYVEPFCGGCGLALELLCSYTAGKIILNDLDRAIYAFWHETINNPKELCKKIESTPCNIDTWNKQREVWQNRSAAPLPDLAFATFFLNRTNRSGILDAGVIGGKEQSGKWKMNARYNTSDLIRRIEKIGQLKSRIELYNLEAISFLEKITPQLPKNSLIYLDPPYVKKGPGLYLNYYKEKDHKLLAEHVQNKIKTPWIVSYDDHPIIKSLYNDRQTQTLDFTYSAHSATKAGRELIFFSEDITPPDMKNSKFRTKKPWDSTVPSASITEHI
ncbi:DNA adenine methylase [Chromobacterium rhizoryzae]|uniref:DNA adenine methylase n=1 Tax=Chromobacterium rhizoryzae TaxID=1778675 RepID=UPI001D0762D7|nr:DNA adenine methylase [Chromobacterium rhizoryzae]